MIFDSGEVRRGSLWHQWISLWNRFLWQRGRKKAELVLKHAKIVNVFTESVEEGDIAIEGGMIVGIGNYEGETETDLKGAYVCPAFWMDIFIWKVLWFRRQNLSGWYCRTEPAQ